MPSLLIKKSSPFIMLLPTVAIIIAYVIIVNHTGVMGYELAERKLQLGRLTEQVKELDIKTRELSALPRVKEISRTMGLNAGGPVEYLSPGSVVAVK